MNTFQLVLKKKQKHAASDNLFGDDGFSEETFSTTSDDMFGGDFATAGTSESTSSLPSSSTSRGLNPDERLKRFTDLHKFVSERIGKAPVQKIPTVRNTAWQHLFMLATTKEQIEQVVEMMPKWRDSKRKFDERIAEVFISAFILCNNFYVSFPG